MKWLYNSVKVIYHHTNLIEENRSSNSIKLHIHLWHYSTTKYSAISNGDYEIICAQYFAQ